MAVPARRAEELAQRGRRGRAGGRLPTAERPAARIRRLPRRRARRAPFVLFSALVVATMLILLASAQALVAQGAFRLEDLAGRADRLEVETDVLRLRVAQLSTPDRIAAAGRRAGLMPPTQVEVLDGGPR
jgi:hypothetical protein